jgi:hypothetical protein
MNFRKIYLVVLLISFFTSCNEPRPTTINLDKTNDHSIAGHYQFFTTGGGFKCETVKHEFDFDTTQTAGTFLYHVFCLPFKGDSTGTSSLLNSFTMIGKWMYVGDSSTIRLIADNGQVIRLRIIDKEIKDFLDDNNKQLPSEIFFHN